MSARFTLLTILGLCMLFLTISVATAQFPEDGLWDIGHLMKAQLMEKMLRIF